MVTGAIKPTDETHRALEENWEDRVGRRFEGVERLLIYVVALFLIGFAVLALVDTVTMVWPLIVGKHHDYTAAITDGIDTAFLTIILLELLHTVLSRGPLSRQLQEFLVIGITSAVRHSLEIAIGGRAMQTANVNICIPLANGQKQCHNASITVPAATSHEIVVDLLINAGGVLVLVAALWLVRHQTGFERSNI